MPQKVFDKLKAWHNVQYGKAIAPIWASIKANTQKALVAARAVVADTYQKTTAALDNCLQKKAEIQAYFKSKLDNLVGKSLSKYGQDLEEIGEILQNGLVKGKYSKRAFNPDKAGGAILKLSWSSAVITKTGIADIKKHLSRLETDPWNDKMIKRLEDIEAGKIPITDFDKRFFTHELTELDRATKMGFGNSHRLSYEEWNDIHSATLEDYALNEIMEYNGKRISSLYHPDIQ